MEEYFTRAIVILYTTSYISAVTNYAYVGPYDICDPELSWHSIPVLPYGQIRSPGYPHPVLHPYHCDITVMVERESWLGIYTSSFSILPSDNCIDSNELVLSSSIGGPAKHFCGVQTGLLYRMYMPSAGSFARLSFKTSGDAESDAVFELHYIIAKAIYNRANISRRVEANNIGHIVSHSEFTDKRTSPGYDTNINASLTLTGFRPGSNIKLDLLYFDVYKSAGVSSPCTDYLKIIGAIRPLSDQQIPKLCGQKGTSDSIVKTLVTSGEELTFTFRTSAINNSNRGFLIRYELLLDEMTTPFYTPYSTETTFDEETIPSGQDKRNHTNVNTKISSVKLAQETTPKQSNSEREPTETTTKDTYKNMAKSNRNAQLSPRKQLSYTTEITIGVASLIVVVALVIIVVIAVLRRGRRQSEEGCYSENIFSVRNLPQPYISRETQAGETTEENIYYNDLEVFDEHNRTQDEEENFYHLVEEPSCSNDQISCNGSEPAACELHIDTQSGQLTKESTMSAKNSAELPESLEMVDNDFYTSSDA
ncbi:uncharacterized protein [Watersipora subatra]|uniref:uncharacterized protein n=1 Tax=Watersipora subatra TaxID=2589382 RepID=UPI00355C5CDF